MGEKLDQPVIGKAMARLDQAIYSLEKAIDKRTAREISAAALQKDLQKVSDERRELASELEKVQARSDRLEKANDEVSKRLGSAMESVRAVLEHNGG